MTVPRTSSSRWHSMVATKQLEPKSPKLPTHSPAHQSALTGRFLAKACEQAARDVAGIAGAVADGARRGDREAVATAEVLFDDRRLERAQTARLQPTRSSTVLHRRVTPTAPRHLSSERRILSPTRSQVRSTVDGRTCSPFTNDSESVIGPFEADTERRRSVTPSRGSRPSGTRRGRALSSCRESASTRPTAQTTSSR